MNLSSYQSHKRMKKHAKKRVKKICKQHADLKARKEELMICSLLRVICGGCNLHLNDFEA